MTEIPAGPVHDKLDRYISSRIEVLHGLLAGLPREKVTRENITQVMIDRWYDRERDYREQIRQLHSTIRDWEKQEIPARVHRLADRTLTALGIRSEDKILIDRATIECVLLDHVDDYNRPAGEADPSLAELATVYKVLTGFDAVEEWAAGQRRETLDG